MSDAPALWRQAGHGVSCEWGPVGAAWCASPGGAVVVVDVLSFSTAVSVAVERGSAVIPCPWDDERAAALAVSADAMLAVGRREVSVEQPWSLSPAALRDAPVTPRLVLPSPNGSAICRAAADAGHVVVVACLRNAAAVARWLVDQGYGSVERPVLLVPAGERWPDGSLRPALEDLLGAGAVAAALTTLGIGTGVDPLSPEADAAWALFGATDDVPSAVRDCGSGEELIARGFASDVEVAVQLDVSEVVPVLAPTGQLVAG